jgi:hypothetical protein
VKNVQAGHILADRGAKQMESISFTYVKTLITMMTTLI